MLFLLNRGASMYTDCGVGSKEVINGHFGVQTGRSSQLSEGITYEEVVLQTQCFHHSIGLVLRLRLPDLFANIGCRFL